MKEVEREFKEIKKEFSKCYSKNKVTKKLSWLSLPISITIFVMSRLIIPLGFLNVIPILLAFLNFLVIPTFKILKKIKHLTTTIKNNKLDLEFEKIQDIYYEIKNFYSISEISDKYLWISFFTVIISILGIVFSDYVNLLIYLLPIISVSLLTSLGLSVKEMNEAQREIKDIGKIVLELEEIEANKIINEKELNKFFELETHKNNDFDYQNTNELTFNEKSKVLKKGSRFF